MKYNINTLKGLIKTKAETILIILKVFLNITVVDIFESINGFRKTLGFEPLKNRGTITLEQGMSMTNHLCFLGEEHLGSLRAELKEAYRSKHESEHRLYHLLTRNTKEELLSIPENLEFIPLLEFEESERVKHSDISKDDVRISYDYYVPSRKNPKEIDLVNRLGKDIHDSALQKASIFQNQLKRGEINQLPKPIKGNEAKEPVTKNILGYASPLMSIYLTVCLVLCYISEAIIFQTIFHHNLGLSEEKSWIVASTLLGVTLGISRLIFKYSERLIRAIKKQWIIVAVFSVLFFTQVAISGILASYNINTTKKTEKLQEDKVDLAFKKGELEDIDRDDNVEEYSELESEIATLDEDVNKRNSSLKSTPEWVTIVGYLVISLTSILVLFFTIILKVLGEIYKCTTKHMKIIENSSKRIAEIEEIYPEKVKALLSAYDQRHLIIYHIAKKHIIELLISQEKTLKTDDYFKAYNITK